ncbi:MAG: hypothetical protein A2Z20_08935 [Bdellovibrionales bacterium RBG_16_40_8]|nr:MAG: hypothetical protein A2Z20_08935 [Bdellovibrionales bacterium RBG_16_40_8]
MAFSFQNEVTSSHNILIFSGAIDERADFSTIQLTDGKELIIDLEKVNRINSLGLRNWIKWIRSLKSYMITLRKCPNIFINQMNILEGFFPSNSIIESFQVPYTCDGCGLQTITLARRGEDYCEATADRPEQINIPPIIKCDKCGGSSVVDIVFTKHFDFLKNRQ